MLGTIVLYNAKKDKFRDSYFCLLYNENFLKIAPAISLTNSHNFSQFDFRKAFIFFLNLTKGNVEIRVT